MTDATDRSTLTTQDIAEPQHPEPQLSDVQEARGDGGDHEPLLPSGELDDLDLQWRDLQSRFVDEPQDAVQRADELVADVMQRLAASFAAERTALESQWSAGEDVSTEDLRVALQRYRSFFHRLIDA